MKSGETNKNLSFAETSEIMHGLLRGELSPECVAEMFDAPKNRVNIYRQFARNHIRFLLEKNFEILVSVLPKSTWDNLFEEYFRNHPSEDYELNGNAEAFVGFLDEKRNLGHPDLTLFHVELAELEWEEFAVYSSKKEFPDPLSIKRHILNPTLSILSFKYPASLFVQEWRMNTDDNSKALKIPEKNEEIVFVMRHPQSQLAVFYQANDTLLFAFKMVHEGFEIDEASKKTRIETDAIEGILRQATQVGLLLAPQNKTQKEATEITTY